MLKEAHRVLKVGGRIGCSVWGRPENSPLMTLMPKVMNTPLSKNFHLGEREKLIAMLEENGFGDIRS